MSGVRRSGRGEHGAGMVTVLVMLFAATGGTVVWLARDVDRALSHRSSAQAAAYEAARAGAQQIDVVELRTTGSITLDPTEAAAAATRAAGDALLRLDLAGTVVSVDVDTATVRVVLEIVDGARTARVVGAAGVEVSP